MMLYCAGAFLWGTFLLSWLAAAAWTSRAVKHTAWRSTARDALLYLLSFALLVPPPGWVGRLWDIPVTLACLLLALELGAFAFAWWARLHLGKLWSGWITLRTSHKVITTGPYSLVRHPIYTGFLGAAWAFALLAGTPTALVGAALLSGHMAWKARREERFLRSELGATDYDSYAAETPMLIPRLMRRA